MTDSEKLTALLESQIVLLRSQAKICDALQLVDGVTLSASVDLMHNRDACSFEAERLENLLKEERIANHPRSQANVIMTDGTNPLYAKYQAGDPDTVSLVNSLLMQS